MRGWSSGPLPSPKGETKAGIPMTMAPVKLWEDLKEAAEEVRLHKQGKIKLKTAQQLLNEL
jgi:hypothetical protein